MTGEIGKKSFFGINIKVRFLLPDIDQIFPGCGECEGGVPLVMFE
jgi:hypothetical protein